MAHHASMEQRYPYRQYSICRPYMPIYYASVNIEKRTDKCSFAPSLSPQVKLEVAMLPNNSTPAVTVAKHCEERLVLTANIWYWPLWAEYNHSKPTPLCTVPPRTSISPRMAEIKEDLPLPTIPTMATRLPDFTSILMLQNTHSWHLSITCNAFNIINETVDCFQYRTGDT